MIDVLTANPDLVMRSIHISGAVVAVGAVLITDAINILPHFNPSFANVSARIATVLSLLVWTGFALLAISGLYLLNVRPYLAADPLFQLKMILITIIFVNGVFLNIWVTPRFRQLADTWGQDTVEKKTFERIAGIAAAVSFIGWVAVLWLGILIVHG